MNDDAPLVDALGRVHTNMRISVTDRCNIRCFYCMPAENVQFKPRSEILDFEEFVRLARVVARMGVTKLRLTGGEPLVRSDLPRLVKQLREIEGIQDIALTTNGLLLAEQAAALKAAGLQRVNISLDGLQAETFRKIARRDGLDRVLAGIAEARRVGFEKVRLNAVAIRGITEGEIAPLGAFAREQGLELRFIEFMPLDADGNWDNSQVLTGETIRRELEDVFGKLVAVKRTDPSQPAVDFAFADGVGRIGFINPVSAPFCGSCNRLRVTAEGQIRNCLFSGEEWDIRQLLRSGADDHALAEMVRECVAAKKPGHGIDSDDFVPPQRPMYQIGG